jgi:hypothetical protein
MHDVQIGRQHRRVAQHWNELSGPQLLAVCRIHGQPHDAPGLRRLALLRVLLGVPNRIWRKLTVVQRVELAPLTAFLVEPDKARPLTAQLLPHLPVRNWQRVLAWCFGRKLYGPADALRNATFAEFIFADTYYLRYLTTGEAHYLDKLVATLYRPQRADYRPHAADFGGDRREAFNEYLLPARTVWVSRVPQHVKYAVLLYYRGCRQLLEKRYDYVFTQENSSKAAVSDWSEVLHQLADGVHNIDATAGQHLSTVLREMNRLIKQHEDSTPS